MNATESTALTKKRKSGALLDEAIALALTQLSQPIETSKQTNGSKNHHYGSQVTEELDQMQPDQRSLAKRLMNEVIFLGQNNMLSITHKISNVDPVIV